VVAQPVVTGPVVETRSLDAPASTPVAAPPADADNVRLNNRVRGMLDAALGSLTLMAKEPMALMARVPTGKPAPKRDAAQPPTA
jgi:hypothetical protein